MNYKNYIANQARELKQGGMPTAYRKGARLVQLIGGLFYLPIAVLFVLFIRLLSPIIKLSFIQMDAGRIGHFEIANVYIAEKKSQEKLSNVLDIVYFIKSTNSICNQQYYKMWKRVLYPAPIIFSDFLQVLAKINQVIPGAEDSYDASRYPFTSDHNRLLNNRITENILRNEPPIFFTQDEKNMGKKLLSDNFGISEKEQYICFHSRDSSYLEKVMDYRNWDYHDFRDSNIYNYIPAVEEMVDRGYYAIRMGSAAKEALNVKSNRIIDYAFSKRRSDFLDIYLSAHCRFFIISDTGLSNPPEVFRRPIVYVNDFLFALLYRLSVKNSIFIFKKYYSIKKERFLTYAEIARTELLYCSSGQELANREIKVYENTDDEILAATLEMEDRISGNWEVNEDDENLQKQFWSLFPSDISRSKSCRVGAQFLRENRELFE